jgi:GDP-D-mannose dehydratase
MAAQNHGQVIYECAEHTANADTICTRRLLEPIKLLGRKDRARFFHPKHLR